MTFLQNFLAAVRELNANPFGNSAPCRLLCACGYPDAPCTKRYRHLCIQRIEREAQQSCALAEVRRKLGWIDGVPPAGISHYMAKCKRLRANGPTPCLCCRGECHGVD